MRIFDSGDLVRGWSTISTRAKGKASLAVHGNMTSDATLAVLTRAVVTRDGNGLGVRAVDRSAGALNAAATVVGVDGGSAVLAVVVAAVGEVAVTGLTLTKSTLLGLELFGSDFECVALLGLVLFSSNLEDVALAWGVAAWAFTGAAVL